MGFMETEDIAGSIHGNLVTENKIIRKLSAFEFLQILKWETILLY